MGIDFLDLRFRFEKEFAIQLSSEKLFQLLDPERTKNWSDVRVREIVEWVTFAINDQNPKDNRDVLQRSRNTSRLV